MKETIVIKHISHRLREKITEIRHKSGLTALLHEKDREQGYAVISSGCGGIDFLSAGEEDDYPLGMAHFLEHKLFANPDEIDSCEKFNRIGAYCNAFTSFDSTAYLASCSCKLLVPSLRELIKSYFTPYFTDENVKSEASIISEEIRMYACDPFDKVYYALLSGMYENPALHYSPCGSLESISMINRENLYSYWKKYYSPANTTVVVSGIFDENEIISVLDECVADHGYPAPERIAYPEKRGVVKKHQTISSGSDVPIFALGIKLPFSAKTPEERLFFDAAVTLLCECFFTGTNDFIDGFYSRGEIPSPLRYSYETVGNDISMITFSGECDDPDRLTGEMRRYICSLKDASIDDERLTKLKRVLLAHHIEIFDSTESAANEILTFRQGGADIFDFAGTVESVGKEDILKIAKKMLNDENISSVSAKD